MYYCSSFSNLSYFRSNLYKKWQNLNLTIFQTWSSKYFKSYFSLIVACHCKRTSQRKNWKSLLMALVFHWSDPQTYFKWISCNIVGQGTKNYAWLPSKIPISLDNSVGKWGVLSHQLPPLWLPPPILEGHVWASIEGERVLWRNDTQTLFWRCLWFDRSLVFFISIFED